MKIAIMVEGKTEAAFMGHLRTFLATRLSGSMPKLDPVRYDGRIPKGNKLKRDVETLLMGREPADAVVALTDVYTGTNPPDFLDAADAIAQMKKWVGSNPRFHPHAAQYDFETWLLPFWDDIQRLAGHNKAKPGAEPEKVNHHNPPSRRLREIFRQGKSRDDYVKARDANRILRGKDLSIAANACPQLKSFLNTLITLCDGQPIA